jgi:hypothetical protein
VATRALINDLNANMSVTNGHTNGVTGTDPTKQLTNGNLANQKPKPDERTVLQIYIDDFQSTNPATSKPLSGSTTFSDAATSKSFLWFQSSLDATKVVLDITVDAQQNILPTKVALSVALPSTSTGLPLEFTTEQSECEKQFDKSLLFRNGSPGRAGFVGSIDGQIFAFKSNPDMIISLGDFTKLLGFNHSASILPLLSAIKLKPRTPASGVFPRSCIWYQQDRNHSTTMRLEMEIDKDGSSSKAFKEFIQPHLGGVEIGTVCVVGKRKGTKKQNLLDETALVQSELHITTSLTWKLGGSDFIVKLPTQICGTGLVFLIQFPPDGTDPLEALLKWMGEKLGEDGSKEDSILNSGYLKTILADLGGHLYLRQIRILVGENLKVVAVKVYFEIPFKSGAPVGSTLSLLTSLSWFSGKFTIDAGIFSPLDRNPDVYSPELDPLWESYQDLEPRENNSIGYLSLPHLLDRSNPITGIPKWIPTQITSLWIEVNYGTEKSIIMQSTLQCEPLTGSATQPPRVQIDRLDLSASYNFISKVYGLGLVAKILLEPAPNTQNTERIYPAIFRFAIEHQPEGGWTLRGAVSDLRIAHLGDFFSGGGTSTAVMNFMSGIRISEMEIIYKYESGTASSFVMDGTLWLGPVALVLDYRHQGDKWSFEADFVPSSISREVSVGDLLRDVVPDFSELPDFVANMTVPLDQISLKLKCPKPQGKAQTTSCSPLILKYRTFT